MTALAGPATEPASHGKVDVIVNGDEGTGRNGGNSHGSGNGDGGGNDGAVDRPTPDARSQQVGPGRAAIGPLAGAALAGAVAFSALAIGVAGGRDRLAFDIRVDSWLERLAPTNYYRLSRLVADGGSPVLLLAAMAVLALWAWRKGDRRLIPIVTVGPALAAVLAELVFKPLIDRQVGPGYTFPSGHATGAAALASIITFTAFWYRHRSRWLIALGASAGALAVALAVVRLGWHVITDAIAGLVLGPAVVCGVAALVVAAFPTPRTIPFFGRKSRIAAVVGGAGAVGAGFIPLPLAQLSPGPVIDMERTVLIDSQPIALNGALVGLTVRTRTLNVGGWLWHELSESRDQVVDRDAVIPAGVSRSTYNTQQRRVFADASQVAAAVAEQALGLDVGVVGHGAAITAVSPGSPADGVLQPGEVITAIDNTAVTNVDDLRAAITAADGRALTVTVSGVDSVTRTEAITPQMLASTGRVGIGVSAEIAGLEVNLATPVDVDAGRTGGPSAGLMTALAVYDALSPTDLTAARRIAGTGTLDLSGQVGPIGGIEEKVRAAIGSGATIFLAPASQADAARQEARGRIEVVAVSTFAEALDALGA